MKRVFIVHQWMASAGGDWYTWLKKELEKIGFVVYLPQMPNQDAPVIKERVDFISALVGTPDEQTYFVGHSIGCQVIMRYFEILPASTKVGGAIFVAGWFNLAGLESEGQEIIDIAKPWIETPINFEKIKKICSKITVLLSSNEPYGYIEENKTIFKEKLGIKAKVLNNMGHFTESDGISELPEILKFFKKFINK